MPWGRRRLGGQSGGHTALAAPGIRGGAGVSDSKFGGDSAGSSALPGRAGAEDAYVLSDLSALREAPSGSYQKVRVQVGGVIEELEMDPWLGPVVYAADGLRQFVTTSILSSGTPTFSDHGHGYANKPWHQLTDTEREVALITAGRRNRKLREWKGLDFIPRFCKGAEPRLPGQRHPPRPQHDLSAIDLDAKEADRSRREFDIVIYGATGYTGQLCAQQLDMLLSQPGAPAHKWALAGRSEGKLRAIAGHLATRPGIVTASSPQEVSEMCRRCRVVAATVGPYSELGEPVVAGCVAQGTHYIDVSGEHRWLHQMFAKYHDKAKAKGVFLVFSAGQESAPYEIMAYKLVRRLGPIRQLRMYMFQYGNVSGGTHCTGTVCTAQMTDAREFKLSKDPFLLGGERRVGVRRDDLDMDSVEQDPLFPSLWTFPFSHSVCQVRIIRRTCALFERTPASGIEYGERFLVCLRDAAPKQKTAEISLQTSARTPADPGECAEFSKGMEQALLAGASPLPGQGATVEARALYYSDAYAVAEAEDGDWAHVHHTGPDTYEITAICCTSGALCLAEELDAMRPFERGGCVTPAFAFHGTTWIKRVEAHAMAGTGHQRCVFKVAEGKPPEEDVRGAMTERSRRAMQGMSRMQKGEIKMFGPPPLHG